MLHISLNIQILCSCGQQEILFLPLKHKLHIFSPACNIPFIMRRDWLCNLTLFCVLFSPYHIKSFLQVWSLESGDCQLTLPGDHSSGVSSVTFNDQWVISGDNSGEIKVNCIYCLIDNTQNSKPQFGGFTYHWIEFL